MSDQKRAREGTESGGWVSGRGLHFDTAILLVPWLIALVGYFGPWIARRPVSAALAWNAYDLFAILRLLPEIEAGAISVNLQALQLPLLGLAVLLPTLLAGRSLALRAISALIAGGLAFITLPPYPQIVSAWRTPGWRVPFWWGIGTLLCSIALVWLGPRLAGAGRLRLWWILAVVELATVPAVLTMRRLLPPLARLHAAAVPLGWGFWCCIGGLTALGVVSAYHLAVRLPSDRERHEAMSEQNQTQDLEHITRGLEHIRRVMEKHEAELLDKANVVSVGIGLRREPEESDSREPGIIVSVTRKVAASELASEDLIPQELDDVPVWVEEIGRPHAEE